MAPAPHATALLRQALSLRGSVVDHHWFRAVGQAVSLAVGAMKFERSLYRRLHRDAQTTLKRMVEHSPELGRRLHRAYAYAVFPCVSQASAVLGSAYGLGELFEHGRLRGYAVTARLTLGLQLGGKWTQGTGFTENGVIVDGVLTKIGRELIWEYEWNRPLQPWRVTDPGGQLAVELKPRYDRHSRVELGVIGTETHQVFGTWSGEFIDDAGMRLTFRGLSGFAEESRSRW